MPLPYNDRPPVSLEFLVRNRAGTRVRWDDSERALLVQRTQVVLSERPGESFKDLVAEAMRSLPPERQRKLDTKTVLWVREAVRALPPLPGRSEFRATEAANPPSGASEVPAPPAEAGAGAMPAGATTVPLASTLIDSGVEILVGILRDPRLRLAVRELLSPPVAAKAESTGGSVVVAGLAPGDAKTVERTYEGMLPLRTWSSEQTREQLDVFVGEARLVIGMQEHLSQAIDSSLRRLGSRYVQVNGGMPALHKRLAEEAMR